MKRRPITQLGISALTTAFVLSLASAALAQVRTPLSSDAVIQGNSGGAQESSCGFIGSMRQTVQVTEPFTALEFRVESSNSNSTPTLLIQGPGGRSQCARADNFSGGAIEVSGVWEQGTYTLFVGEPNSGTTNPVRLTIHQD